MKRCEEETSWRETESAKRGLAAMAKLQKKQSSFCVSNDCDPDTKSQSGASTRRKPKNQATSKKTPSLKTLDSQVCPPARPACLVLCHASRTDGAHG